MPIGEPAGVARLQLEGHVPDWGSLFFFFSLSRVGGALFRLLFFFSSFFFFLVWERFRNEGAPAEWQVREREQAYLPVWRNSLTTCL